MGTTRKTKGSRPGSPTVYIRNLIRRDQARTAETETIRAELLKGERSGEPKPFDAGRFKRSMTARHVKKAR